MKTSTLLRRFYALQHALPSEWNGTRRARLAALMCKVEAQIAGRRGETVAWMTNRKPDYYLGMYEGFGGRIYREEVIAKAAA